MNAKRANIKREHGQTLLVTALIMAVLMGFMAMAVDVGLLFKDRRHLQNSADAMALAGVQELPMNPLAAEQQAENWAAHNGIAAGQITTIDIGSTYVPNDTLYVEIDEEFGWIFARVLGMDSDSVSADAAAVVGTLTSGEGHAMPWALLDGDSDCLDADGNAKLNETCSVKVGAQGGIGGWRGALDFDGNGGGANEYKSNIIDGTTDTTYCIDGTYASEPPQCEASVVDVLDGNKVGPSGSGIDERLTGNAKCDKNGNGEDDFGEVFLPTGGTPPYTVACPDSPWLVMIPIVSPNQDPVQSVTIKGWALGYLDTYSCASVSAAPANSMAVLGVSRAPAPPVEDGNPTGCKHKKSLLERSEESAAFVQAFDPGTAFMPVAGGPASPPRCHNGSRHGRQTCPTPTPSPAPTPTPALTPSPTPTPAPTPAPTHTPPPTPGSTPTPEPTSAPTPSPTPGTGSCNGNGHWEVQIQIVDASYSAAKGFLTGFDPAAGITVRRLVE